MPPSPVLSAPRPERSDLLVAGVLLFATALGWCGASAAWTPAAWGVPVGHFAQKPDSYLDPEYGDTLFTLAMARAASEGRMTPFLWKRVPQLGAPHVAEWSDWPLIEEPLVLFLGACARLFGPFAGLNVTLLVGHLLAALCMYAVARSGGTARPWAFVAGLAFGLAPFIFAQSPHHVTVAWAWHVPLFVLAWRWCADPAVGPGDRRFAAAAAIGAVAGVQNPYYTNVLCQLALLAGGVAAWRSGSWRATRTAAAVVAAAAVAFLLMHLDTLTFGWAQGRNPGGVVREYKWLEIYGLKIVDLFVPLTSHRSATLAARALEHRKAAPLLDEGASYLGILGIACLAWLVAVSVRALVEHRSRDVPAAFWQVLWIIVTFGTGGLNAVGGTLGLLLFRTGCRYAVVILAIVLEFASRRMTDAAGRSLPIATPGAAWAAAAALAGLVAWDQTPLPPDPKSLRAVAEQIDSDRRFVRRLDETLPAGAKVFQLPIMEFPESPAPGVGAYEQFRPYVLGSGLHWSFGTVKGRPREAWIEELSKKDAKGVVADLRARGFAAVVVNRNGFPERARGVEAAILDAAGTTNLIRSPAGDQSCILLGEGG